jgi:hypothetical protein
MQEQMQAIHSMMGGQGVMGGRGMHGGEAGSNAEMLRGRLRRRSPHVQRRSRVAEAAMVMRVSATAVSCS